jgi:hypothetical protein
LDSLLFIYMSNRLIDDYTRRMIMTRSTFSFFKKNVFFLLILFTSTIQFSLSYGQVELSLDKAAVYSNVKAADLLKTKIILREEIRKRSGILLKEVRQLSTKKEGSIILTLEEEAKKLPLSYKEGLATLPKINQEGYKIWANRKTNSVVIMGKDARGLLYGVGHFLKKSTLTTGKIRFNAAESLASSPQYPIRGHQLGYRPKTNSYDAFSVAQFDQYIRELALFGANSIEILPPRTDDQPTSTHMKVPPMMMNKEQSRIAKDYGLDVWMWYPNLEKDYKNPEIIKKELAEREAVFKNLPRLDAVFSPGGDPGDLEPDELFAWMEKVSTVLHKYHPHAKIWLSPQSFRPDKAWFDAFFKQVNRRPEWLGGVVFGPWVKIPIEEIRKIVHASIPIRNYPDITHSTQSQYQVPQWDPAWFFALGREGINPRPQDFKLIHNIVAPYCVGSISYSEGTNDDLNKFIWSDQDWSTKKRATESVKDYARFFFGAEFAEEGALALNALEENHRGDAINNIHIQQTLWKWQALEKSAPPTLLKNPRFQMGLLRALYDAYTQERLIYETRLEKEAREILLSVVRSGDREEIKEAIATLQRGWEVPIRQDLKYQCLDLADDLFESIGAQLTVVNHGGQAGRGNFIDFIQYPLTDAPWLIHALKLTEKLTTKKDISNAVLNILHRTDPGPGGYYDHFGNPKSWKRVYQAATWKADPGSLQSIRMGYGTHIKNEAYHLSIPEVDVKVTALPIAWSSQVEALYGVPLRIRYDDLDPSTQYRIKISYTGRFKSSVKLKSDDGILIHDHIRVDQNPFQEFDLPHAITKDGFVEFEWSCLESERGVQVSEIWLEKIK